MTTASSPDKGADAAASPRKPVRVRHGCLRSINRAINGTIERAFHWIGFFVARFPWITIAISVIVAAALASGIHKLENETRGDELWIPSGTESKQDEKVVDRLYPRCADTLCLQAAHIFVHCRYRLDLDLKLGTMIGPRSHVGTSISATEHRLQHSCHSAQRHAHPHLCAARAPPLRHAHTCHFAMMLVTSSACNVRARLPSHMAAARAALAGLSPST